MNLLKKNNFYIGLDKYSIYKEDIDNSIFNVIEVPEIFPAGKTSFLILGSDYLRKETDVLVEILDSTGQVIYHEIIKNASEKRSRIVSVYVYDHIERGPIKITILGVLKNVPEEWKNKFNVRQTIFSYVDPTKINNSPLKFLNIPNIDIKYVEKLYINYPKFTEYYLTKSLLEISGYYNEILKKYFIDLTKYIPYANNLPATVFIGDDDSNIVKKEWLNGIFYIKNFNIYNYETNNLIYLNNYEYSASIINLVDNFRFEVLEPFIYSSSNQTIVSAPNSLIYIKYKNTEELEITKYTTSFIEINITNINQYSGLVDRIRVYKENKSIGNINNYLGEYKLESSNLFISSEYVNIEYGKFNHTLSLDFWDYKHISGIDFSSSKQYLNARPTILYDEIKFFGSIKLIPKYSQTKNINDPPLYNEEYRKFILFPKNFSLNVFKGNIYEITAKYFCLTSSLIIDRYNINVEPPIPIYITQNLSASLGVYVSGSAYFQEEIDTEFNYNIGKRIGYLTSTQNKNFNEVKFEFIPRIDGNITLLFAIFSGIWNIADIKIKQKSLYGFNVNNFKINVPLNNQKRDELASIKVEFLNPDGEISNFSAYKSEEILLKNQPIYIEKEDNLIVGKLFISNNLNSGIVLSSTTGSLLSSPNYLGKFNAQSSSVGGFLLYSGSVFPTYSKTAVGFELNTGDPNKGFLEFRYDPISGSYLNISASIYALSGSNISNIQGLLLSSSNVFSFTSSMTWSIQHNLNEKYLTIQTFNNVDEIIIPERILTVNNNQINVYFTYPVSGKALIYRGGYFGSNNSILKQTGFASRSFTNQQTWSFNHNLGQRFVFTETFNNNGFRIIPSSLRVINNNLLEIYFPTNTSGIAIATTGYNINQLETYTLVCAPENTIITPTNNLYTIYMPHNFNIQSVKASINTISIGNHFEFNILINNSINMFSENFIIPVNSYFASTTPDISFISEGSRLTVNVLHAGTNIRGLKIYLIGYR